MLLESLMSIAVLKISTKKRPFGSYLLFHQEQCFSDISVGFKSCAHVSSCSQLAKWYCRKAIIKHYKWMEFSFHGNMFKLGKMFLRRFSQIRDTNKRFEKHTLQLNESGHNTCRHELSVAADCDRLNFGSSTWLQDWEGLRVSTCDQHLH